MSALGFNNIGGISFEVFGTTITLTGLAIAAILGIVLNAAMPGKDFEFVADEEKASEKGVDFKL